MANDNETVEQVCKEMCGGDWNCDRCGDGCDCPDAEKIISSFADRILAAHNREIAAKVDARLTVVSNYENVICAKDRIIAAKDAENASLRELVKELADALEPMICIESCDACDAMAGGRMDACRDERARHYALIAKAREAVE